MRNKLMYCFKNHGFKFIKIDSIVVSGVKSGNTTYLVNVKMLTESWLTLFLVCKHFSNGGGRLICIHLGCSGK